MCRPTTFVEGWTEHGWEQALATDPNPHTIVGAPQVTIPNNYKPSLTASKCV